MTQEYPVNIISQLPVDKTYVEHEKNVLEYWKNNNIYQQLKDNNTNDEFEFMDGPPFVSGNLHLGHLAVGSLKDTILRYQHMHGKKCLNRLGYDCHGLPIESVVMKELNLATNADILNLGIDKFNQVCKNKIIEFSGSWEPIYDTMGRWADFTNVYKTMDPQFMESVWWVFKCLYDQDLIYKSFRVMPYSYGCETPLSNFEAGLNYREIDTKTIYVCFTLKNNININFVAWTTTPWTLPSNVALCVNPNMNYVICTDIHEKQYIIAEDAVQNLKLEFINTTFYKKGIDMVGLEYIPLYDYLNKIPNLNTKNFYKIIADDYVSSSENIGTGIVHQSPSFGDDDCRVCVQNNIIELIDLDKVCPIDSIGCYTSIVSDYQGISVFDANELIIKELKLREKIVRMQMYRHQYPYCYRTDTPLIYRAISSFFVAVTKIKDKMIDLNDKINWSRKEIGSKRFKNWLEQAKDWGISRNRHFGTPIPVWMTEDGTESVVIGSIKELEEYANLSEPITDLHKEYIDKITITSKSTGKILKRVNDILDCWFESGSVPFGQIHYPFENSHYFDNKEYLSEFIAEGLDQTRGWFYTLLVIATATLNKPPFKNVICTGLILDKNGVKFSKKYGNFVDPHLLINKYGADVMRLYLLKSPLVIAEPLLFNESDVGDLFQKIIPYVNGVKFFLEHYINSQKEDNHIDVNYIINPEHDDLNIMDMWILENVSNLRIYIEKNINQYQVDSSIREIITFIDDLTNWYIKFNRDRLKGLVGKQEWKKSLSTLFTVLYDYIVITSPFTPFFSEHLYQYLSCIMQKELKQISVHCLPYINISRNYNTCEPFVRLQKVAKLIRSIRYSSTTHLSVKTPIKKCTVYHYDQSYIDDIKVLIDLIQDEVNCTEFEFNLISEEMIIYQSKPNFKTIGQKYRKYAPKIKDGLMNFSQNDLKMFYKNEIDTLDVIVELDGEIKIFNINKDEVEVIVSINTHTTDNIKVIENESLLLCVDLTYDNDVIEQYKIRCLASFIQNIRKKIGLRPWNKITVKYNTQNESISDTIEKYQDLLIKRLGTRIEKLDDINNICVNHVDNYSFDNPGKNILDIDIYVYVLN